MTNSPPNPEIIEQAIRTAVDDAITASDSDFFSASTSNAEFAAAREKLLAAVMKDKDTAAPLQALVTVYESSENGLKYPPQQARVKARNDLATIKKARDIVLGARSRA